MSTRWEIRGVEFNNCNCAFGCPCQFNAPATHGHCEAVGAGRIDEGYFGDARLDGLHFAMVVSWPGQIAEGNGRELVIIDERADAAQREGLRRILHGEDTAPGTTHFFVFNSTMSEVLPPLYAPIDLDIDVEARRARVHVPGVLEARGTPIVNPHSGEPFRARIGLPEGFEFGVAEVGMGSAKTNGDLSIELRDSHAHFNLLHMNQDGVIRDGALG